MRIYVGNLAYTAADEDLRTAFEAYGQVTSAQVVMDRDTGRSRGFGFVEMPDDTEGEAAIENLNGISLVGRAITVNQARPREGAGGPRRPAGNSPRW